jgi:GTPase SAR1 family protein
MVDNLKQTNVLLCGSSRVGKSTLINAICQRKLTKSNASLNSITKSIERFSYECTDGETTHETVIWDTPGIESWNENDVRSYMVSLIEQTQPLCMIYCASPGSFAVLHHVAWLVSECYRKNIFCALVCTNMWAGRNREEIVKEFCRLLSIVHPKIEANKEGNIIYYDNVALVTMVNSQEYTDNDFGVTKSPSGVEELIFGIGKSLNRDLMFAWFRTVSQNTSFWSKMSSKLSDLFKMPTETFNSVYEHAATFLDFLFDVSNFSPDCIMPIALDGISSTTRDTVIYDLISYV